MAGLVTSFAEFSLLPDLLALRYGDNFDQNMDQWTQLLTQHGCNTGHVETTDLDPDRNEIAIMAEDAWNLTMKLNLLDSYGQLTNAGQRLVDISETPLEQRHHGDYRIMQNVLANQIQAHYRGAQGLDVPTLLLQAAQSLENNTHPWGKYCPGLLLNEFSALCYYAETDAGLANTLATSLLEVRRTVMQGRDLPAAEATVPEVLEEFDDSMAIYYEQTPGLNGWLEHQTLTGARASAMLFKFTCLLREGNLIGSVNFLTCLPVHERIEQENTKLITLRDGSQWTRDINLYTMGVLLGIVLDGNFRSIKGRVLPQLGTDLETRQQVGNRIRMQVAEHRVRNTRKIDLALSMELLVALILSKIDSPDRVVSNCVVENRYPNNFAPGGFPDILAEYAQGEHNEQYFIMAEVSARNRTDKASYQKQLEQAYDHAEKLQKENPDQMVYALIVNTGDIGKLYSLQEVYKQFIEDEKLTDTSMVRIVPFSGHDLASAVKQLQQNVENGLPIERQILFSSQQLAAGMNALRLAMFDDREREEGWMAQLFCDTVTADSSLNFKPSSDDGGFKPM